MQKCKPPIFIVYSILFITPENKIVCVVSSTISNKNGLLTFITFGLGRSKLGQPAAITSNVTAAASVPFSSTLIFTCCAMSEICKSLIQSGMTSFDSSMHANPMLDKRDFTLTLFSTPKRGKDRFTSSRSVWNSYSLFHISSST